MAPRSFMRRFAAATTFLSFAISVSCSPLLVHQIEELAPDAAPAIQRRQSSYELVTGITEFGVQPRLEIRQLQQNADQWNIYLLGLARWQAMNETEKLSYYQIAGIHGRPYRAWDGVQAADGIHNPSYCVHISNIFLPWHRPYLALYEQTLHEHIIAAVNEFPAGATRQRYAAAALSWRMPYWDWAATPPDGESVWPSALQTPTVRVRMPNGTNTIPNPLFAYRFHAVSEEDFHYNPFSSWNVTMRFPTNWTSKAVSQNDRIGPQLDNNRVSFQDRLYNLLTYYDNFTQFGNEAWIGPSVSNADSLESVHDVVHAITGNNGHMTYLDYSAFDPVFWLHHTMIDRVLALWQGIYKDSYVKPMAAKEQTFTIAKGTVLDEDSPLSPFHRNEAGDMWTAASVRSTRTFGYTYSDLGNGSVSAVRSAVNRLYGRTAGNGGLSRRSLDDHSTPARALAGAANEKLSLTAAKEITNGKHRQYVANILSQKFALNGSYGIYLFMGDFEDDPKAWGTSPNLIGTHGVFAAISDESGNDKIRRDQTPIQVTGAIPLTSMLLAKVEAGELDCMDVPTVTAYLTDSLHWRIGKFDGTTVPAEDVPDLTVTVISAEAKPAKKDDEFPGWSNWKEMTSITQGKPGGCA